MPERIQLSEQPQEEEAPPARKLTESEARRLLLVRIGAGFVALVVLIWLIGFTVDRLGARSAAGRIYRNLQQQPSAPGAEADLRAFAATLTYRQVRRLAAGRSLDYERLTPQQRGLFASLRPLGDEPRPLTPYQVRLDQVEEGRYELRFIWAVPGSSQAVVRALPL